MVWYPANRFERELAWRLSRANYGGYFQVFLEATLYEPRHAGPDDPGPGQPVQVEMFGATVVPVFTSEEGLLEVMGEDVDGLLETTYQEVRENWPDPRWRLAINPTLPIRAYLPVDVVEAVARHELLPPFPPEVVVQQLGLPGSTWEPWPPGGPEAALFDAVSIDNGPEYLDALLSCTVVVPATREMSEAELTDLLVTVLPAGDHPDFPWCPVGPPADPTVEVFTNLDLVTQTHTGRPWVTMRFHSMLSILPPGYALSVNPDGPAGFDLGPRYVPLLRQWKFHDRVPRELMFGMRWAREALRQASAEEP